MKAPLSARERRGLIALVTVALLIIGGAAWMRHKAHKDLSIPHTSQSPKALPIEADSLSGVSESVSEESLADSVAYSRKKSKTGGKRHRKKSRTITNSPSPCDPLEPIPTF